MAIVLQYAQFLNETAYRYYLRVKIRSYLAVTQVFASQTTFKIKIYSELATLFVHLGGRYPNQNIVYECNFSPPARADMAWHAARLHAGPGCGLGCGECGGLHRL
jgi:hypothetical protein